MLTVLHLEFSCSLDYYRCTASLDRAFETIPQAYSRMKIIISPFPKSWILTPITPFKYTLYSLICLLIG